MTDHRTRLTADLTPEQARACGLGQTGAQRCRWLQGMDTCGAVESIRQGLHAGAIKVPRDETGRSLCPKEIGVQKQQSRK